MDNLVDKVLALRKSSLFQGVSEHVLVNIAEHLVVQNIPQGTQIIKKGDLGHSMYIIIDGQIEIRDHNKTLATLSNDDIVGELAILAPVKRTADAVCTRHSVLYELTQEDFLELLYYHRSMNRNIMQVLVSRIIQLNSQVRGPEATPVSL